MIKCYRLGMPTRSAKPISLAEAKSLFAGLEDLPVLVLAVSGGPDSTALMLLAASWRDALKTGPKLTAVTIDHGLRKESKREAAAVARLARRLGVAHRTLRWSGRKPATGLPKAARAARYRLLAEAGHKLRASHILTAHTLDDQAETVLIRMSRGSGLTGLGAMQRVSAALFAPLHLSPSGRGRTREARSGEGVLTSRLLPPHPSPLQSKSDISDFDHVRCRTRVIPSSDGEREPAVPRRPAGALFIVRPLLDVPKERLIATLDAAKIPYAEDPSNRDLRFMRARLRVLMPALAAEGLTAARLAQLARRLKRADQALEAATDRAAADLAVRPMVSGGLAFDAAGFARLPAEIGLRLLGRAVAKLGDEGPVELAKLETLKTALETAQDADAKRFRRSLAGALVTLSGAQIVVERAPPRRGRTLTTGGRGRAGRPKTR